MFAFTQSPEGDALALHLMDKVAFQTARDQANAFSQQLLKEQGFEAKWGTLAHIYRSDGSLGEIWVGLEGSPEDPRAWLHLFADIAPKIKVARDVVVDSSEDLPWEQAALGWGMAGYSFDRYVKAPETARPRLCVPDGLDVQAVNHQLQAIFLARDLINTPALDLSPDDLVEQIRVVGEQHGATFQSIHGTDLLEENYPAIYAVGMGSDRRPALGELVWGNENHPKLTLVGKGVVFDTGGLNLKGAAGMKHMKKDMGGGAIALALAKLVMSEALPVRLRLLVPTVENSPASGAYRPGDVLKTRKGLSVEIGNTDAEGRVILCDALAEAVTEEPDLIIDFATLTGACRVALGQDIPGFWTPSEAVARGLEEAGKAVADPMWQMPLWRPYRKHLKSKIADLNNMANTGLGGAITAALFLHEFVKPFERWLHIDVFGWRNSKLPGSPEGGEAGALRAVFAYLRKRYS